MIVWRNLGFGGESLSQRKGKRHENDREIRRRDGRGYYGHAAAQICILGICLGGGDGGGGGGGGGVPEAPEINVAQGFAALAILACAALLLRERFLRQR